MHATCLALPRLFARVPLVCALILTAVPAVHARPNDVPATIEVAIVPNYPPFEFKDPATNELRGFDVDLGKALAERAGVRINWQETSFDTMMSALRTKRVDIILSGMTDTPARRSSADFIDYIKTGPQFFTLKTHGADFATMTSLCGKRVGASRRTTFPDNIKTWSDTHCVATGKPAINVIGTDGSADARLQLQQGRLDAAVQGGETLPYQNSIEGNAYVGIGEPFLDQYTAIAVGKSDTALREALTKALASMIADGSYTTLLSKWNLQTHAVSRVNVNSQ